MVFTNLDRSKKPWSLETRDNMWTVACAEGKTVSWKGSTSQCSIRKTMISVVVPAYNEQDAITDTIERLARTLKAAGLVPFEIVVVNDGSSDLTGARAEQAGARVLRHPHNVGYGKALKTGIQAACYDTIAITDADGTYPLEDIPKLVKFLDDGFDMVVGERTGPEYREGMFKTPLRWILRKIVEYSSGTRIPDVNSGLRVFRRSAILPYFTYLCDTFSFTTSMTLAYAMNRRFVHYVRIGYHPRIGSSNVRMFRDTLRTLQYIVEAVTYYNPLKIFLLFGFCCFLIAGIAVAGGIALQILSLFLLGVGSILVGILIFGLGLLAVLLKQTLFQPATGGGSQGPPSR